MTREYKSIDEKMHAGEESNFTWFPSYTETYRLLNDEERLDFMDVLLNLGTYGEAPEDGCKTRGGGMAMTLRATIANSRESSITGRRGGKRSGESRRARKAATPSEPPFGSTPSETLLPNPPSEPSGVERSGVEQSSSEEEKGYLGSSSEPSSFSRGTGGEDRAPFGLCDDCDEPLIELPQDYKGERSYQCPECGRLYDAPNTAAPPNGEPPF